MSLLATAAAMDPAILAALIGATIALNLSPGPDLLFISASGAAGGPRTGIAAGLGVTTGSLVHTLLAIVGVAALIAAHPAAFTALKWTGAAYLAYLAFRAWTAPPATGTQGARTTRNAFAKGAMTNILNPKVSVFVLAFLPQFTDPAAGPIWHQIAILGLLFSIASIPVNITCGALAGTLGSRLRSHSRLMNRLSAAVFGALAARLILAK